ncbi:MAG: S49 family peptidase, partial [Proteobacteria bacterium]|nr:S49 family peptidase [Pseudomonadota bacterium]
ASIGVISEFVNLHKLYEWAKVERVTLKAGKLKDAGTENRAMTPEERDFLTALIQDIHKEFKAQVKERRKLTTEEVERWTDGRVMTGSQAKAAKLIDQLGGLDDAITEAKKQAGLPANAPVSYLHSQKKSFLRDILLDASGDDTEDETSALFNWANYFLTTAPDRTGSWRVLLLSPVR